ncbi:MAG: hypothetical protein ABIF11_09950 [Nitrospirota bacterium]
MESPETARDIDIACDGVDGWKLFELGTRIEDELGGERGDSLQNIPLAKKLQIKYVQRGDLWKYLSRDRMKCEENNVLTIFNSGPNSLTIFSKRRRRTIMSLVIKEHFVTDENGRKTNVLLSLKDYQRLKRMAELFQEEDTFTKEDDCYIEGEMQAFVSSPEGERIAKRMADLKYKGKI